MSDEDDAYNGWLAAQEQEAYDRYADAQLTEIDQLRARLAEVEALYDAVVQTYETRMAEVEARAEATEADFRDLNAAHTAAEQECSDLRARLAEVEATDALRRQDYIDLSERLAAVLALCDGQEHSTFHDRAVRAWWVREVRAAAAGDRAEKPVPYCQVCDLGDGHTGPHMTLPENG